MSGLLALWALGCAPEAPETVEEMMVYGFQHFEDEDPEALVALGEKLVPWLEAHHEESAEGYSINSLTQADLALVGVERDLDEEGIIGAMVALDYAVSPEELAVGVTWPDQTEIFVGYLEYDTVPLDDRDCFLARSCDVYRSQDTVHADLGIFGIESWYDLTYASRWLELADGRTAYLTRVLGPDPITFSVDYLKVSQQYNLGFAYQRDDGSIRRAMAVWAQGEVVGADMPENFQINTAVNTMVRAAGELEAWLIARREP